MTFGVQTRVSIWMLKERARTQRCSPQGASPSPSSGFLAPAQQNKDSFGYFPMQNGCRLFFLFVFFCFPGGDSRVIQPLSCGHHAPDGLPAHLRGHDPAASGCSHFQAPFLGCFRHFGAYGASQWVFPQARDPTHPSPAELDAAGPVATGYSARATAGPRPQTHLPAGAQPNKPA